MRLDVCVVPWRVFSVGFFDLERIEDLCELGGV